MRAMRPGTDRFEASFRVHELGVYEFTLEAWVASFATWRRGLAKKVDAGVNVESELLEGAALVTAAAKNAPPEDCAWLQDRAARIGGTEPAEERANVALDPALAERMARLEERVGAARYGIAPRILVERERAAFGAWYEFFPRSASREPGRHGTFRDAEERLAYAAAMGFDVVYLPPIHPIGVTHRKGPNNSPVASPGDAGSPWAIGAAEGGFTGIHPELGTEADFARLVKRARALDLELALDIAFQCSPDHPWVKEHPEWFRWRPDGTVQYAENPPKKYQDVFPLDFEGEAWRALWDALLDVILFWVDRGVRIFRVDNPHTKPFPFWEWLIAEVRAKHPGRDLPGGGLHPALRHEVPGQVRLLPVLHLLHLAQHQGRADGLPGRPDARRCPRVPASELLCEHARHPPGIPPVRAVGRRSRSASCSPRCWPATTASTVRPTSSASPTRCRARGVSRLREVRDPPLGPGCARQPPSTGSRA